MADSVQMDTTAIKSLNAGLIEYGKQMRDQRPFLKKAGVYMQGSVERRYRDSGPNRLGVDWKPIQAASFAQRFYRRGRKPSKAVLKQVRENPKQEVPTGKARPLLTQRAAVSVVRFGKEFVTIAPVRETEKYHSGLPPRPANKMPDRGAFFTNNQDDNRITGLAKKETDRQMKKFVRKLASKSPNITASG